MFRRLTKIATIYVVKKKRRKGEKEATKIENDKKLRKKLTNNNKKLMRKTITFTRNGEEVQMHLHLLWILSFNLWQMIDGWIL